MARILRCPLFLPSHLLSVGFPSSAFQSESDEKRRSSAARARPLFSLPSSSRRFAFFFSALVFASPPSWRPKVSFLLSSGHFRSFLHCCFLSARNSPFLQRRLLGLPPFLQNLRPSSPAPPRRFELPVIKSSLCGPLLFTRAPVSFARVLPLSKETFAAAPTKTARYVAGNWEEKGEAFFFFCVSVRVSRCRG